MGSHSNIKGNNEFSIPTDIKDIDRQIKEGELLFGFGRGRFADDPYTISSINGPDTQYSGIGYSGTIYLMHQGPCMSEVLVPITLSEQRLIRMAMVMLLLQKMYNYHLTHRLVN